MFQQLEPLEHPGRLALEASKEETLEIETHIEAIRREGQRLAAAASRAGMDAPIPWCPRWDTRELLRHLSEIHLWAASPVAPCERASPNWPTSRPPGPTWRTSCPTTRP
ncbi:MAG: maleylpyruvate isomerase N-terminal domain-containing protein [Acidimicrobiia bacterium]